MVFFELLLLEFFLNHLKTHLGGGAFVLVPDALRLLQLFEVVCLPASSFLAKLVELLLNGPSLVDESIELVKVVLYS